MHKRVVDSLLAEEDIALHEAVAEGVLRRFERRGTLLIADLPRIVYGALGSAHGAVPDLSRQRESSIIAALRCDNYDTDPPSLSFVADWDTTTDLPYEQWPKGASIVPAHHATGKPFVCWPGVREFHLHLQHSDEPWDKYRGHIRPRDLLARLAHDLRTKQVLE